MNLKAITVACDCGHRYTVPASQSIRRQAQILDFAICPRCLAPRIPFVWKTGDLDNRCTHCGVPFRICATNGAGLCKTCYNASWRTTKQKAVATVNLNPDGGH